MAYKSINSQTAQQILKEMKKWRNNHSLVKARNENWYIGITSNPIVRQKQHESKAKKENFDVSYFSSWNAKTINIALAVETFWHEKGMLETDIKGNYHYYSKFIYVYKKYPLFKVLK